MDGNPAWPNGYLNIRVPKPCVEFAFYSIKTIHLGFTAYKVLKTWYEDFYLKNSSCSHNLNKWLHCQIPFIVTSSPSCHKTQCNKYNWQYFLVTSEMYAWAFLKSFSSKAFHLQVIYYFLFAQIIQLLFFAISSILVCVSQYLQITTEVVYTETNLCIEIHGWTYCMCDNIHPWLLFWDHQLLESNMTCPHPITSCNLTRHGSGSCTYTTLQQTPIMPSIHVLTIKVGCYKFILTMNYGIQVRR